MTQTFGGTSRDDPANDARLIFSVMTSWEMSAYLQGLRSALASSWAYRSPGIFSSVSVGTDHQRRSQPLDTIKLAEIAVECAEWKMSSFPGELEKEAI